MDGDTGNLPGGGQNHDITWKVIINTVLGISIGVTGCLAVWLPQPLSRGVATLGSIFTILAALTNVRYYSQLLYNRMVTLTKGWDKVGRLSAA